MEIGSIADQTGTILKTISRYRTIVIAIVTKNFLKSLGSAKFLGSGGLRKYNNFLGGGSQLLNSFETHGIVLQKK